MPEEYHAQFFGCIKSSVSRRFSVFTLFFFKLSHIKERKTVLPLHFKCLSQKIISI